MDSTLFYLITILSTGKSFSETLPSFTLRVCRARATIAINESVSRHCACLGAHKALKKPSFYLGYPGSRYPSSRATSPGVCLTLELKITGGLPDG